MALQSSGPISFADINAEFARGAGTQLSMSQLYRGGAIVPNATVNQNIPTSGQVSLGQFYGATRRVPINITISTNQTNYVLNTAKAAGYVAGVSDVVVTINSGIYLSANATGVYALDVDTSWSAGDTLQIVNNGFIVGMGGVGGNGVSVSSSATIAGSAGASGGPALRAQATISVTNNGTIAGGGGGGGGGRGFFSQDASVKYDEYLPSSGGGGGRSSAAANATGGAAGTAIGGTVVATPQAGGAGTVSAAGNGGITLVNSGSAGGNGGNGGGWGSSGTSGTNGSVRANWSVARPMGPYTGGAGGAAVAGNANITWLATGTRLGTIA